MQLVRSPQIIERLSEFDDYFKTSNTECWESKSGNINLYCFSAFYPTAKEFEKDYKELRDHVAVSFQSRTLQKAAERWNLYLLFMVKELVPQDLKQRVIHDKFSTRKIVHSTGANTINDKYVERLISSSLLDIDIKQKPVSTGSLDKVLRSEFPKIALALERVPIMANRDYLPELLKLLGDD